MSPPRWWYRTALLLVLLPAPAAGQTASVLLAEGLRAYGNLDFAAAAQLLRSALEAADAAALPPPDRLRALMHLGAANVYREERDDAVAAFRSLVLADPRFRPDSLVFPPRVTQTFDEVLQTTKAVGLVAPPEARFTAGTRGLQVRAYVTSRHRIQGRITTTRGQTIATLFGGVINEYVTLTWDGLDANGAAVPPGRYLLVVFSSLDDEILRSVRLPLEVAVNPVDTLPWPAPPPRPPRRWDRRFLYPGAVLGVGLALPAALGIGGARTARISFGIAFATIGLVGGWPRAAAPDPRAATEWQTLVTTVRRENQRRRNRPEMVIRTGQPESREGPAP